MSNMMMVKIHISRTKYFTLMSNITCFQLIKYINRCVVFSFKVQTDFNWPVSLCTAHNRRRHNEGSVA